MEDDIKEPLDISAEEVEELPEDLPAEEDPDMPSL
jgi:hypothetical protein